MWAYGGVIGGGVIRRRRMVSYGHAPGCVRHLGFYSGWYGFHPHWAGYMDWLDHGDYLIWHGWQQMLGTMTIGVAEQRNMLFGMLQQGHGGMSRREIEALTDRMLQMNRQMGAGEDGRVEEVTETTTTTTTTTTSVTMDQRYQTADDFLQLLNTSGGMGCTIEQAQKTAEDIRQGKRDDFVRTHLEGKTVQSSSAQQTQQQAMQSPPPQQQVDAPPPMVAQLPSPPPQQPVAPPMQQQPMPPPPVQSPQSSQPMFTPPKPIPQPTPPQNPPVQTSPAQQYPTQPNTPRPQQPVYPNAPSQPQPFQVPDQRPQQPVYPHSQPHPQPSVQTPPIRHQIQGGNTLYQQSNMQSPYQSSSASSVTASSTTHTQPHSQPNIQMSPVRQQIQGGSSLYQQSSTQSPYQVSGTSNSSMTTTSTSTTTTTSEIITSGMQGMFLSTPYQGQLHSPMAQQQNFQQHQFPQQVQQQLTAPQQQPQLTYPGHGAHQPQQIADFTPAQPQQSPHNQMQTQPPLPIANFNQQTHPQQASVATSPAHRRSLQTQHAQSPPQPNYQQSPMQQNLHAPAHQQNPPQAMPPNQMLSSQQFHQQQTHAQRMPPDQSQQQQQHYHNAMLAQQYQQTAANQPANENSKGRAGHDGKKKRFSGRGKQKK